MQKYQTNQNKQNCNFGFFQKQYNCPIMQLGQQTQFYDNKNIPHYTQQKQTLTDEQQQQYQQFQSPFEDQKYDIKHIKQQQQNNNNFIKYQQQDFCQNQPEKPTKTFFQKILAEVPGKEKIAQLLKCPSQHNYNQQGELNQGVDQKQNYQQNQKLEKQRKPCKFISFFCRNSQNKSENKNIKQQNVQNFILNEDEDKKQKNKKGAKSHFQGKVIINEDKRSLFLNLKSPVQISEQDILNKFDIFNDEDSEIQVAKIEKNNSFQKQKQQFKILFQSEQMAEMARKQFNLTRVESINEKLNSSLIRLTKVQHNKLHKIKDQKIKFKVIPLQEKELQENDINKLFNEFEEQFGEVYDFVVNDKKQKIIYDKGTVQFLNREKYEQALKFFKKNKNIQFSNFVLEFQLQQDDQNENNQPPNYYLQDFTQGGLFNINENDNQSEQEIKQIYEDILKGVFQQYGNIQTLTVGNHHKFYYALMQYENKADSDKMIEDYYNGQFVDKLGEQLYINQQLPKKICSYLRKGKPCKNGEHCQFNHSIDSQLCKYIYEEDCNEYLNNQCKYKHKKKCLAKSQPQNQFNHFPIFQQDLCKSNGEQKEQQKQSILQTCPLKLLNFKNTDQEQNNSFLQQQKKLSNFQNEEQKENQKLQNQNQNQSQNDYSPKICCVCKQKEATYATLPCGHKKYCKICIIQIFQQGQCHLCQEKVSGINQIYD
ncbi:hypothetical protein PPERSA_12502 [Pseudocohnilembus persalinus]|uniref:Uncharacterized protein n=1 Tax=Pseudocohnilembus persalinus TaxID=266149 RepID=A0A0V0QPL2_PSEPJ|nr:hypothetical protein PPERSA_12502 [Pseudocohnilembus persalinus]|eukprot:KRX04055.1 hypothetical protein PPERSA_12502 [Pseudocohnilembus persalinus]